MATGPELFREALRLRKQAAEWMDVDWGWKGKLSTEERLAFRMADLAEAQVCATLANAAATAMGADMGELDFEAWDAVCGVQEGNDEAETIDAGEEWGLAEREHQNWLAAEPDGEQAGAEIDQAVESTGHLPGWVDNEYVTVEAVHAESGVAPVFQGLTVDELRAGTEEYVAKVRAALDSDGAEPESEA